jgi:hypothetical protein
MEAGDIRPQVLRAIEDAKHLVLILSRRALNSDWIKREWSHARMMGKRVVPVLADPALKRADLRPWMPKSWTPKPSGCATSRPANWPFFSNCPP